MPVSIPPLLFAPVLHSPGLWRALGDVHGLSSRDFQWLGNVQLATQNLRSQQTDPMLAHRIVLNTEGQAAVNLAGCFVLSFTPTDRSVMLYTPFDGLKKFANLTALTEHLEERLGRANEEDRLLAFLAISQRKDLAEKRGISVTYQLIEGDVFDDQRATIDESLNLNARTMLNELMKLPELGTSLEAVLNGLLASTMPGVNQAETRVTTNNAAGPLDNALHERNPRRRLDSLTLGAAVLLRYRHIGWPSGQPYEFSHPRTAALASNQAVWRNAIETAAGKLLPLLFKQMEVYWSGASEDGSARRDYFGSAIRQQALADVMLKREAGIIDAGEFDNMLPWLESGNSSPRRATLETVRLWEYQANYVELAGSLMISQSNACLYTPSQGLQVLKDYQDLKDTLLSKLGSIGLKDELYGLLNLDEQHRFLGFSEPHVSGETIAGDIFNVLLEAVITKQRQNIERALQVFRHSEGKIDIAALFDKALDIRSMIHDRLLTLDTKGRWSTRPTLSGSQLPSMVLADTAGIAVKKFNSILPLITTNFAMQPFTTPALQRTYLESLKPNIAHSLYVGICGEAKLRVLKGELHQDEQAVVDTVFDPDRAGRNQRKGLNGFRPDAWSLTLRTLKQDTPLPLANCVLLTERGGLDAVHSGRAILWTPATGLKAFGSVESVRKTLNQWLSEPEKRLALLENLSPLIDGIHQQYVLGDLRLITDNVLHDRTQSAIEQFLERSERVRRLDLQKPNQEKLFKALSAQVIETNLQRATAQAKALATQQSLPAWLGMAGLDEQQLHLELLEQWRNSVNDDKDYLHAIPTLNEYAHQTLKQLLGNRFRDGELDPDLIEITPALALAGPAMNLTRFALDHSHTAQKAGFTISSGSERDLPAGLNQSAVRSLLLSLNIGSTFANNVTAALSGSDAESRKQRFVRQLPWQLLQHAHQLKLQQRLTAGAFDLITQVLDMPDAIARATVEGAHAMIRPLELLKTPGAAAVKALGLYLIGPITGQTGPQVLYSPYHGEHVFTEFESEIELIAALNAPGVLQDMLVRRLPENQKSGFITLFESDRGKTSEITLAANPVGGNALIQLFNDNLALLPRLLSTHSLPSAQQDWEAAKNLFSSGIKMIGGLLPGKLAYVQFLWQSFKDFKDSAEALQDHHWKRALGAFIAGAVEMVTLGRMSMESTLETQVVEAPQSSAPVPVSPPRWTDIKPTAAKRTSLQTFETPTTSLKDLTRNPANGTYEDLSTKATYAPVAGKVYPVERPGIVWQIKGTEQDGPVLQHTTSGQLVLDPDRHTVHFGKALSKMYNRHANDRETRLWLNIEAQGMTEIRAKHPEKARMLMQAVDLARFYAFNSLHNMAQLNNYAPGSRLDQFLKAFFDTHRIDSDILAKVKQAIVPICNALVDPAEDLMNTDRFVVGSNKYRQTNLIAFVLEKDSRKKVHFTEKFFNQELDWYKSALTEPFNVEGHAQASTLIHEFAHQASKAVDIASMEARRPFADLIATVTGYGAAMKASQTRFQREALSLATPREELFSRWSHELREWVSLDDIPGTAHIGKAILKATLSPTMEDARTAFLNTQNPHPRIDTILRNADSIAFLICEMGRKLDPVINPSGVLT
ncbi:dermonecrotic toxin domain-containing protein [Pseudomonas sp. McL0111]|uniref:dermonecrotic toxin domain-containing protein n=1 Tax=Pseudomonas sp. McL0111 TaxID=3457357 RepID=UPI00403EE8A1